MTHSRRTFLRRGGASVLAITSLAGCTDGTDEPEPTEPAEPTEPTEQPPPSQVTVEMTDTLKYVPETVEIATGGSVTWTNEGVVAHSVTAYEDQIPSGAEYFASGGFDSESAARQAYPEQGAIGENETYAHTFEVPGTYEYICIPHESGGMIGTVVVSE